MYTQVFVTIPVCMHVCVYMLYACRMDACMFSHSYHSCVILLFQPPKKKASGKKKPAKQAKAPTIVDGVSTEEMTKPQVNII